MKLIGILMVCCIATFGLGIQVEDVGTLDTLNVVDYGAVGDCETNDSLAFVKACGDLYKATRGMLKLIVPADMTFLLMPTTFQGLCNSRHIVASSSLFQWQEYNNIQSWLSFSFVNGLIINGGGQINGQGSIWWYRLLYDAVHFSGCNNLQLSGLHSVNPPRNHITINNCKNVIISHINLNALRNSPNTNGIDISGSSQIQIHDSNIATSDDCIVINGNSSNISITGITYEVYVRNCRLNQTTNGARIKTWQVCKYLSTCIHIWYARNITFDELTLFELENPTIINQNYCDHQANKVCRNETSTVQISEVTYRNMGGSSISGKAINLRCGESQACTNIVIDRVNIYSSVPGNKTFSFCYNACGTSFSTTPSVPCLSNC
ncbi:putative polygalacturonase [Camellia lanceoleosa]|uniref:Polygalacturonase n=1 Tax=Camellia lanceoleosa TaxID=1840588 RepID=A0ACC0HEF7_9ERIC|nr:putative polygalacturonase [Camellia lanceoleosa]